MTECVYELYQGNKIGHTKIQVNLMECLTEKVFEVSRIVFFFFSVEVTKLGCFLLKLQKLLGV